MSYTKTKAEREFDILEKNVEDALIVPFKNEILALCEKFGESGQSGGSAPYTAGAISQAVRKLLLQQPIFPITGEESEWNDVSEISDELKRTVFQNNRCSALFKQTDEKPYYLDAIVWCGDTEGASGNNWDTFTGIVEGIPSSKRIKEFPFEPKTFYIDVTREILPEDWTEEPFFEDKYYDTKEFEETGNRNGKVEKYRYIIKDKTQLKEVYEYYDEY